MRKFLLALKLAAAGLLLTVVTTTATALVALFGDSDCLRATVFTQVSRKSNSVAHGDVGMTLLPPTTDSAAQGACRPTASEMYGLIGALTS